MIQAVLFDLDDTLYPEASFYRSGFSVVADVLAEREVGDRDTILEVLETIHFRESREGVFNKAAKRLGFPEEWVSELVWLFHSHTPQIELPPVTMHVLGELCRHYRLGIVTDGHAAVQRRKIESLGLWGRVDCIVITDDLGRKYWKPDPTPFVSCCRSLRVKPHEAVFVGDHPERDIFGAKRAGLTAIRIRRPDGFFRDREDLPHAKPWRTITDLMELPRLLEDESPISMEGENGRETVAHDISLV
ncbi:MAG: HAD family hydrolase [Planctomycetota bacterium]|nr:MAG: HAD family hydrolase [Planctomycetota bacterium]